ncbi:MAG: tRNA pseudouridine(55) synthase TruB [Saprospiraceae bacterium]|nr:tRNA pseudouridine(55) synthase TruB [Saprospiraceae bacterium]
MEHMHPEMAREGLLFLVDKPSGWTSFDVVNKCRWLLRKRLGLKKFKVGHAGTLDPMATGLLLICAGPYTKRLQDLQGMDKVYSGAVTLGAVTASYDADSREEDPRPWDHIEDQEIQRAIQTLTGEILQQPPAYSALKVDGQRAYALARKGQEVILAARPVTVHSFDLISREGAMITFRVHCSKGTYIRSLAHDLGQILGCGAYLSALQRDAIGPYTLPSALHISDMARWTGDPNESHPPE